MNIKIQERPFAEIISELHATKKKHRKPKRPNILFRTLMRVAAIPDLVQTSFKCEKIGMEKLGKKENAFFLMNHSSFIDLEIAAKVLYPRPFNIITTSDGFIGKDWLMHNLGCVPTKKFVSDTTLVRDMLHCTKHLGDSILMYPEASYTFDGTATTLPESIGKCVKLLGLPLVMIKTEGAFSRDPLYNNLQRRKVKVKATMTYLLSKEEIASMPDSAITELLQKEFTFDGFRWQQENGIKIPEPFRADGLNRILYKCPKCMGECCTEGKGVQLVCHNCNSTVTLDELGFLRSEDGITFNHVPDWYSWERECVKKEIEDGSYRIDFQCDVLVSVDTKKLYRVGEGRLIHDPSGFTLVSEQAGINYTQKPLSSYSLYSDFNWYEVGDVICIGDGECLYYCIPKKKDVSVAKARIAAEELYKICKEKAARVSS